MNTLGVSGISLVGTDGITNAKALGFMPIKDGSELITFRLVLDADVYYKWTRGYPEFGTDLFREGRNGPYVQGQEDITVSVCTYQDVNKTSEKFIFVPHKKDGVGRQFFMPLRCAIDRVSGQGANKRFDFMTYDAEGKPDNLAWKKLNMRFDRVNNNAGFYKHWACKS
jgi:hypothetical protein